MDQPRPRATRPVALFRTRITELYGIRLPVIASGLMWLANADYVGAAVNAGLMGFMTSASFPDPDDLRNEIRRCREITQGKPFGVNIGVQAADKDETRIARVLDVVIGEGVQFVETYGHNPQALLPRLRDAGIKVLHKVPAVRFARKAQSVGVDAVTVIGAEAGGHPGMDLVGTMVQAGVAARDIRIPLIVAGGIGTGHTWLPRLRLEPTGGDRHALPGGRRDLGAPQLQGTPGRAGRNAHRAHPALAQEDAAHAGQREDEAGRAARTRARRRHRGLAAAHHEQARPPDLRDWRLRAGRAVARPIGGVRRSDRAACRHRRTARGRGARGPGAAGPFAGRG